MSIISSASHKFATLFQDAGNVVTVALPGVLVAWAGAGQLTRGQFP